MRRPSARLAPNGTASNGAVLVLRAVNVTFVLLSENLFSFINSEVRTENAEKDKIRN